MVKFTSVLKHFFVESQVSSLYGLRLESEIKSNNAALIILLSFLVTRLSHIGRIGANNRFLRYQNVISF